MYVQKSKPGTEDEAGDGYHRINSRSRSLLSTIKKATEMHVAIVNSPSYSPKCSYTEALKKHFHIPRILSVGDVFAVPSSGIYLFVVLILFNFLMS